MKFVPKKVTSVVSRQALKLDKASPKVLFIGGIAGFGATVVLASRATLKVDDVLSEAQNDLNKINNLYRDPSVSDRYSMQDAKHDKLVVYVRGARGLVKLYAPSIIVGSLSVLALTKSHNILQNRVAGLTAAYAALEQSYSSYRRRVADKYGADADQEIYYATAQVEVVNDDGKKEKIGAVTSGQISPYGRVFDETNNRWSPEPRQNQFFVQCQQNYANDLLRMRGHVFLNEVYDLLGFDHSKEGAVVGWILNSEGDNYIDFGVFDGNLFQALRFVNGDERSVFLDFNVDGVIYDKI